MACIFLTKFCKSKNVYSRVFFDRIPALSKVSIQEWVIMAYPEHGQKQTFFDHIMPDWIKLVIEIDLIKTDHKKPIPKSKWRSGRIAPFPSNVPKALFVNANGQPHCKTSVGLTNSRQLTLNISIVLSTDYGHPMLRNKSKKSENLGRFGRQNMLRLYS